MKKKVLAFLLAVSAAFSLCVPTYAAETKKATAVYPYITLDIGSSITISGMMSPSNADETVAYASSNKDVITVSSKGKITAKSKGTAYVKCTTSTSKKANRLYVKVTGTENKATIGTTASAPKKSNGKTATAVYPRLVLSEGSTITAAGLISPSGTGESVKYSTSNEDIITVSSKGKITAKTAGTAYIKYTTSTSKKTNRLYITVVEKVKEESKTPDYKLHDTSDKAIESISTFGDFIKMLECIVANYLAGYEGEIKNTPLWNETKFGETKEEVEGLIAAARKEYSAYLDIKLPASAKSEIVTTLKEQRDIMQEMLDVMIKASKIG